MSSIPGKDTVPEMRVRRLAHSLGYRFRLHRRDLPGTPDLVFPSLRKVIFVHGCFWHRHSGCSIATSPKSREGYWQEKFARNVQTGLEHQGYFGDPRVEGYGGLGMRNTLEGLQKRLQSGFLTSSVGAPPPTFRAKFDSSDKVSGFLAIDDLPTRLFRSREYNREVIS